MPAWLALTLAVLPIMMIAVYGTKRVRNSDRTRQISRVPDGWVPARGVVVDERLRATRRLAPDGKPERMRQPVITFQSADGREVTFRSRLRATAMPRPGSLVGIYHDPVDPTRACIAPESLPEVIAPMEPAARVVVGFIWLLAAVTIAVLVILIFVA
jgi:hypothetical protein